MNIAMLIAGILTVIAAAGVIFCRRPLYSALSLIATLFLVAVHFALLGAQFIAALQILIYAGAIMVLVIFVIMLLGLDVDTKEISGGFFTYLSAAAVGLFVALLVVVFRTDFFYSFVNLPQGAQVSGTVEGVGMLLFTEYLYPFEIASVLLLVAIIGAVLLAQEPKRAIPEGRGLRAKQQLEKGAE